MQWWHGKQATGDSRRIFVRPQNEEERVAISMLTPPPGSKLTIRPHEDDSGRFVIEVVVDENAPGAADVAKTTVDLSTMELADLKTYAAEKRVTLKPNDDRGAILRKLAEAK